MSAPLRLQTHVWNPSGRRRALLLHGLTSDGTCWWRLASELADADWMVLAPDLRSHGRSPTALAHDLATLAADVALLGGGWDLLVGHSMGGAVGAHLLAGGHQITAAVLVDPVLRLDARQHADLRRSSRAQAGGVHAEQVRAEEPTWDERDVQRKVLATAMVTPDVVDAVLDHNDPWDVTSSIARWEGRIHLLAADPRRGGWLAPALADAIASSAEPPGRVTASLVHGCGHSIQRERPEVVTAAVQGVLSTL